MQNTYSGLVWYQVISRCLAKAEDPKGRPNDEAPKDETSMNEVVQAANDEAQMDEAVMNEVIESCG